MEIYRFDWNIKGHRLLLDSLYELSSPLPNGWIQRILNNDPNFFCLFSLSKTYKAENLCLASLEGNGTDYSIIIHHFNMVKKNDFRESCIAFFESLSSSNPLIKRIIYQTTFGDMKTFTKSFGFKLERIILVKEIKSLTEVNE